MHQKSLSHPSDAAARPLENPHPVDVAISASRKGKRGRGMAQQSKILLQALHDIYEEIQPASVRAGCYQLFGLGLIPDMSKNTTGKISKLLVWARENEIIPWSWIVDEHRREERAAMWSDTGAVIDCLVSQYRRNNWREQAHWIQVWSEKGTVRGSLWPVLRKYGVGFQVAHGFQGASIMHDTAEDSALSAKPLTILYVGDYDPSGMCMSESDLPNRMARYGGIATIRRLALTKGDTTDLGEGPSFPATDKIKDPRYPWFVANYGDTCWELDSLSPAVLRERVEATIVDMIDWNAWSRALVVEQAEIDALHHYQAGWKESISRLVPKYSDQGAQS